MRRSSWENRCNFSLPENLFPIRPVFKFTLEHLSLPPSFTLPWSKAGGEGPARTPFKTSSNHHAPFIFLVLRLLQLRLFWFVLLLLHLHLQRSSSLLGLLILALDLLFHSIIILGILSFFTLFFFLYIIISPPCPTGGLFLLPCPSSCYQFLIFSCFSFLGFLLRRRWRAGNGGFKEVRRRAVIGGEEYPRGAE